MEVLNCKNPDIVSYLAPWFVPAEKSIVDMCVELRDRLETKPQETLCLLAMENKTCHGILISYKFKDCVWIWQARARAVWDEHYPSENYTMEVFNLTVEWAKLIGAKSIKMKCKGKGLRRFFQRRYGFKPLGGGKMVYDLH